MDGSVKPEADLPAVEDYTFLGTPASREKWTVEREGVLGLRPGRWIPWVERRERSLKVLFDPSTVVPWVGEAIQQESFSWHLDQGYLPVLKYQYRLPGGSGLCRVSVFVTDGQTPGALDGYVSISENEQTPLFF